MSDKILGAKAYNRSGRIRREDYESELERLQIELVKLQEWIKAEGLKVVVLFEGRDAAGKGGAITRITEVTNPRVVRVVTLGTPSDRERTQSYFQRYAEQLPAAGEMVLFDRSWYNRAGRRAGHGFRRPRTRSTSSCGPAPSSRACSSAPASSSLKYWFSVSDEEQERRFQARMDDPTKRWKLSPMDIESRARWEDYSFAKDEMFAYTDTKQSPWWVVDGEDKRTARLNCISHLLSMIPYEDVTAAPEKLPPRPEPSGRRMRPPMEHQSFVPDRY